MSGCSLHFAFHGLIHCYSNCGVLAEALARHRIFIIPAHHRMLFMLFLFIAFDSKPRGVVVHTFFIAIIVFISLASSSIVFWAGLSCFNNIPQSCRALPSHRIMTVSSLHPVPSRCTVYLIPYTYLLPCYVGST